MTKKQLSEKAGIRPNTVTTLFDESIQRLDKRMLDNLCKTFECSISDILEYIPDQPKAIMECIPESRETTPAAMSTDSENQTGIVTDLQEVLEQLMNKAKSNTPTAASE